MLISKNIFRILIFSFFVLCSSASRGQQVSGADYQHFDSLTSAQHKAGNWKPMIQNGKLALASGFDNKHLRMRMGIAYYSRRNYRLAAEQFLHVLNHDQNDTAAARYLNLIYPAAGRGSEIYQLKGHPKAYKLIDFVNADAGIANSGNSRFNAALTDTILRYKELTQPISRICASVGMNIRPTARFSFYIGYSEIRLTDRKGFGYFSQDIKLDSVVDREFEKDFYHSTLLTKHLINQDYNTKQSTLYLSGNYILKPGFRIVPAFHILRIHTSNISAIPFETAKSDTAWYDKTNSTWHTFNYQARDYHIQTTDTSYYDYAASLSVNKETGNFSLGVFASFARIYSRKIAQTGVNFTYYPFGNTNLYAKSKITLQVEKSKKSFNFEQLIGGNIYKNGWLEVFFTSGELKNFTDNDAYLVYNHLYPISMRWGFTFYPMAGKHFDLILAYRDQRIGLISDYSTTTSTELIKSNPDIRYSTLTLGLKWKF